MDSTRILRARNYIFENKFSRVDYLAKCHRHFSPGPPFGGSGVRVTDTCDKIKRPPYRRPFYFGGVTGTRTPDPLLAKQVL